jgi:hypothetical protein
MSLVNAWDLLELDAQLLLDVYFEVSDEPNEDWIRIQGEQSFFIVDSNRSVAFEMLYGVFESLRAARVRLKQLIGITINSDDDLDHLDDFTRPLIVAAQWLEKARALLSKPESQVKLPPVLTNPIKAERMPRKPRNDRLTDLEKAEALLQFQEKVLEGHSDWKAAGLVAKAFPVCQRTIHRYAEDAGRLRSQKSLTSQ